MRPTILLTKKATFERDGKGELVAATSRDVFELSNTSDNPIKIHIPASCSLAEIYEQLSALTAMAKAGFLKGEAKRYMVTMPVKTGSIRKQVYEYFVAATAKAKAEYLKETGGHP